MERVEKEIEIHRSLHHKNIVQFFCDFEQNGTHYIVMEYCPNGDVLKAIKNSKNNRLPVEKVRKYFTELINAVRYLHSKIIIHRDLKPQNMLLDVNDNVKLCDFGLSTFSSSLKLEENSICGTMNYISPEIFSRKAVTLSSDIFSVGCVLYTMIVGVPPYTSQSKELTIKKAREGSYDIPAWVDSRASDLIRKLMNVDINKRPSFDEILMHPFIKGSKTKIEPKKCPFKGGCVEILDDGSILLDIFGHPTLFKIYPDTQKAEVFVRGNENGKSHTYDLHKLPQKYHKRYEMAMKIVQEAEKSKPLVIWNSEEGKFLLFYDFSLGVICRNTIKIIPEGFHDEIRSSAIAIVNAVKQSGQPRWPVIVGRPTI